jgi:hypothetical protein
MAFEPRVVGQDLARRQQEHRQTQGGPQDPGEKNGAWPTRRAEAWRKRRWICQAEPGAEPI